MALFALLLGGMLVGIRSMQKRTGPRLHPEWARKSLHIVMGLASLSFPWLFARAFWAVATLGVCAAAFMYGLRAHRSLRNSLGCVTESVGRGGSWGAVYFPLSIGAVYIAASGDPVAFGVPVLLLALGDAAAALAGVRSRSVAPSNHLDALCPPPRPSRKTFTGSAVFFAVAVCCILIPLLVFTNTGPAASALIAVTVALLAAVVEAASRRGLDNLLLPVLGFALITALRPLPVADLALRFAVAVSLAGAYVGFAWRPFYRNRPQGSENISRKEQA